MISFSANSYVSIFFIGLVSISLHAKSITIGMSADLSGPSRKVSQALLAGIKPTIKRINAKGGIRRKKIKFIVLDDKGNPEKAVQNTITLIQNKKVDLLFSYVGTNTTLRSVPIMLKYNVPLFFPMTGAHQFHEGDIGNMSYHWRPTYWEETKAIVQNFRKRKKRRIAVYFQKDALGQSGLMGVKKALKRYKQSPVTSISYIESDVSTNDYGTDAFLLLEDKPDAIIVIGSHDASLKITTAIRKTSQIPIALISEANPKTIQQAFRKEKKMFRDITISQVVPREKNNKNLKYYKKTTKKRYHPITYEGYLNTIRLNQLLKSQTLSQLNRKQQSVQYDLDKKHGVYLIRSSSKGWIAVK